MLCYDWTFLSDDIRLCDRPSFPTEASGFLSDDARLCGRSSLLTEGNET